MAVAKTAIGAKNIGQAPIQIAIPKLKITKPRGFYEPAASIAACLSMKHTKAMTRRPARVLAYRS